LNNSGDHPAATAQGRFRAGFDDVVILPLVTIGVAARKLSRIIISMLIRFLDYAFPILLQLARFPLFTVRIIGDGLSAGLKGIVTFLPVSSAARDEWRRLVSRYWSWLRQKVSYKAFEEALHHAFEEGMAWVFRACRTLTPGAALLVIAGAVLWLPISFGVATAMHAVLIAKAASLPAWMQLLHPLATVIAKSKLLVLPAYPAAWPQARKHLLVQATFRLYEFVAAHYLMRKTAYRYRQTESAAADASIRLGLAASQLGLSHWWSRMLAGLNDLAARLGKTWRTAMTRTVQGLSALPLIGAIVRRYALHYDGADQPAAERLSERVSGFFARWSIKFSVEYYEAKDASKGQDGAGLPSAVSRPRTDT